MVRKMKKLLFAGLIFILLIGMQATYAEAALNIKPIHPPTGTTNDGDGWEKGENIAKGAYTVVYNPTEQNNDPSKAVDGSKNTYVSMGLMVGSEAWLLIDLGLNSYLYEIHVYAKRASSESSNDLPPLEIQTSLDNKKWETMDSFQLPNDPFNLKQLEKTCKGEKARYVRIFRPPLKSNGWGHPAVDTISIFEVEVYEAKDVSPPTVKITSGPENGSIVKGSEKDGASFSFKWEGVDNAPKEDILYSYRLGKNAGWSEWTTDTEIEYKNHRSEGKYFFEVRTKDISGNIGNKDSRWFYIDNSKPNVEITWPQPGYFYLTLFDREILPWIEIEDKSHAVVVGSGKLQVSVSDRGSGVSGAALYLMDINPDAPVESKDASDRCTFNIYNGEHLYNVVVFDKAGKSNSATIKINGIFTGIDPPGYLKVNTPPYQTAKPNGVSQGKTEKEYTFTCRAKDAEGDNIYYLFEWGDNSNTGWLGPYTSEETVQASHSWSETGTYKIKVKVKDSHGNQGDWYAFTEIKIKDSNNGNNQHNKDLNSNKHVVVFKKTKPVSKPVLNHAFNVFNKPVNKHHQLNINPLLNHISSNHNGLVTLTKGYKVIQSIRWT